MSGFGELPQDQQDRPLRLAVPTRSANPVEQSLRAAMFEDLLALHADVPTPFIEDGELANNQDYEREFGRSMSIAEIDTIGSILAEPVVEKFRRQICAARDLGRDGTLADYIIACELLEIPPLVEKIK